MNTSTARDRSEVDKEQPAGWEVNNRQTPTGLSHNPKPGSPRSLRQRSQREYFANHMGSQASGAVTVIALRNSIDGEAMSRYRAGKPFFSSVSHDFNATNYMCNSLLAALLSAKRDCLQFTLALVCSSPVQFRE